MTAETYLIAYFKFNLLLLASYFLWDIAKILQRKFCKHQSATFQLSVARILFVTPILLPLAISLLSLSSPSSELEPGEELLNTTSFIKIELTTLLYFLLLVGISVNAF